MPANSYVVLQEQCPSCGPRRSLMRQDRRTGEKSCAHGHIQVAEGEAPRGTDWEGKRVEATAPPVAPVEVVAPKHIPDFNGRLQGEVMRVNTGTVKQPIIMLVPEVRLKYRANGVDGGCLMWRSKSTISGDPGQAGLPVASTELRDALAFFGSFDANNGRDLIEGDVLTLMGLAEEKPTPEQMSVFEFSGLDYPTVGPSEGKSAAGEDQSASGKPTMAQRLKKAVRGK